MKFPSRPRLSVLSKAEKKFLESYRQLLLGQYAMLPPPPQGVAHPALAEAKEMVTVNETDVTWEHLYRLELALIELEPDSALHRHAWSLRNEYKELATEGEWKDYIESHPPELNPISPGSEVKNVDDLRVDMVRIQKEINWRYIVLWAYEDYRSHVTSLVFFWSFVAIFILAVIGLIAPVKNPVWLGDKIHLLALVVIFGVTGGLTNTMRRIQNIKVGGNADVDISKLGAGNITVYLSPLLGGLFAFILYLMFAGRLINGDLFPDLDSIQSPGPTHYANCAKLLVWSFTAGFLEQLVPDNLARLGGKMAN